MKSVLKLMTIIFIVGIFSILLFKNTLAVEESSTPSVDSSSESSVPSEPSSSSEPPVSSVPSTSSVASVTSTTLSNNADVLSIVCKEGIITPIFNPLIKTGYTVNVQENITQANFTVTTANKKALISVVGNRALTMGDNKVTITITAEDKKTKNIYEINVIKGAAPISSAVSSMVSSTVMQSESKLTNNLDKSLLSSLQGLKEENQKLKENNNAISEKFAVITILLVVLIAILATSLVFVIIKFREI